MAGGKIGIIIQREYFNRVRSKVFIAMCIIAPILIAGLVLIPPILASQPGSPRQIVVVDASGCPDSVGYAYVFKDTVNLHFNYNYVYKAKEEVVAAFRDSEYTSILYIPEDFMGGCHSDSSGMIYSQGMTAVLESKNEPGFNTLSLIQNMLSVEVQRDLMKVNHLPQKAIDLSLKKVTVADSINGKYQVGNVKSGTGFVAGLIIYIYILIFGVLVMRSVVEEKQTRIVEIIVSSVKPFQLMFGKIIAMMLVGLTQFLCWVILSMFIIVPIMNKINDQATDFTKVQPHQMQTAVAVNTDKPLLDFQVNDQTAAAVETIKSIPWDNLIPAFMFYFIFGYLMYASLFAAVGSAVDTDVDTGQFSLPITIPLIIAIASFGAVLNDPDGPIATWLSMIPFTSPVVMLMRIPFGGVKPWEILLSGTILVLSFLLMTWIAGRIYRVGILMYGKKASWKELAKWMFYRG